MDHGFLASSYHNGIISGFILVASALKDAVTRGKLVIEIMKCNPKSILLFLFI